MNFDLTEEQKMLQDTCYKWAVKEMGELQEKIDEEDWLPPGIFKSAGDVGIMGIAIDPEYGGSGMDVLSEVISGEQVARIAPGVGLSLGASSNLCAGNIQRNANDYLKGKYLPGLVSGELVGALGLTEPGAGSDAMSIATRAEKKGDRYILNGTKMFITNGPIADVILVYAKTNPEAGPFGITAFLVEKEFPGFSCSKKLKKVGMRGSPTGELRFENCEVPEENIVGGLDQGVNVVTRGLDIERVVCAAGSLGIARQAIEYSIRYANEREQFNRPISKFQMIQAKLAEMYTRYQAARSMTYQAAVMADNAERGGKGTDLTQIAAAAAYFASEAATAICCDAIQIHGGYGYCLEFPVQKLWRDAKLFEIGGGTNEIRKMIIAREMIRKGHV